MFTFASNPVIVLTLAAVVSATAPFECLDPPGNGAIANKIVNALNSSRTLIADGVPEKGIPPLDPLGPLPRIAFNIDTDGLKMNFELNETTITHLSDFIICQLNVTLGRKEKFSVDLMLDNFHIGGFYELDGIIAHLLPVFGSGTFTLDVLNSGIFGGGKITPNIITKKLTLSDLQIDIFYDELHVVLDGILGGGEMEELVEKVIDKIGTAMFDAIWGAVKPILTQALEDGINEILHNL